MVAKRLWVGMFVLAVLSPIGLILPDRFKAGAAWGEWGVAEIKKMVGYAPQGLAKLSELWTAPIPDYSFKGWEQKGWIHSSIAYSLSAFLGIVLTAAVMMLVGKMLSKKDG